ncbi:hypothetical protein KJ969_02345 [Patescibacteria group bacterium]|nr:hypothetical protein [Patescibacteria group bacterium]MBU1921928.1 hypothetical protein [Patescibacteria group bacterium]
MKKDWNFAYPKDIFLTPKKIINFAQEKNISLDFAPTFQKGLESRLSQGYIDGAQEIINFAQEKNITIDLTKPEIASAFQEELEACLSGGYAGDAQEIINFAQEKNISLDLIPALQKGLNARLFNGEIDVAKEINNRFLHLSAQRAFEILSPHLQELLDKFQQILPDFLPQVQKSIDLLFNLFEFRNKPGRH